MRPPLQPGSKAVSDENANEEPEGGRSPGGRLGRRVGIALFWMMLCYVIGMSSFSILPSLFWPKHAPRPPAVPTERCATEIAALDQELLRHTEATLRGEHHLPLQTWLRDWDGRYLALSGGCGALEPARKDLLKLRTGIESLIHNYERGPGKARQRIQHALEPMSDGAGPARSKG